jgi:uncharacterized membrane protein YphA (DoxX/SURF4 family)
MKNKIGLLLRLIAAVILLQTLYFKFTGAPESKYIFSTLGIEPWGRWFSGVSELIASILLLVPVTQIFGALMAIGIMSGAILSHLFVLGIVVQDDGGTLFVLACVVLLASLGVVFIRRDEIPLWISKVKKMRSANVGT